MRIGCVGIDLYRSRKGAGTFSATPPPCTSESGAGGPHQSQRPRRPRRGQIIARPGAGANTERTQKPHNSLKNHNSAATIDCAADFLPVPFGPDRLRPAGSGSRFPAFADRFGLIPSFLVGIQCAFYPLSSPRSSMESHPIPGQQKATPARPGSPIVLFPSHTLPISLKLLLWGDYRGE